MENYWSLSCHECLDPVATRIPVLYRAVSLPFVSSLISERTPNPSQFFKGNSTVKVLP